MSRAENASEPSMEDILSSIRKIISEDPVAKVPPAAPVAAAAPAPSPAKPSATPSAGLMATLGKTVPGHAPAGPGTANAAPSSLDEVLGLADGPQPSAEQARPVPSWMTMKPGAAPHAPASPPAPASQRAAASAAAERPAIQPYLPPQSREALPAGWPASTGAAAHQAQSPQVQNPATQTSPAPNPPTKSDFGAVVPGRSEGARFDGQAQAALPGVPRFGELRPDAQIDRLNSDRSNGGNYGAPSMRSQPVVATPADAAGSNRAEPSQQPPSQQSMSVEPVAETRATLPSSPATPEAVNQAAKAEPAKPAVEPPKAEITKVEIAKAVLPLETISAPLAGARSATAGKISTPDEIQAPVTPAPSPVQAAKQATPMAAPAFAPAPVPAVAPGSPAASGEPTRTMEDTVAELLRPMLRQWLDTNMPRVVEKALRVELAASVQPKPADPAKH